MKAPTLTFPCDYPIKIFGKNDPAFVETVFAALRHHLPNLSHSDLVVHPSRQDNYLSITLHFVAQSPEQIAAIYASLKENSRVLMVL